MPFCVIHERKQFMFVCLIRNDCKETRSSVSSAKFDILSCQIDFSVTFSGVENIDV